MRRLPLGHVAKTALQKSYYRLATDLGGPARALNMRVSHVATLEDLPLKSFQGSKKIREELMKGHFNHARQELDVGAQGDPWTIPAPSERFAFWLHSFEWLHDLCFGRDKSAIVRARYLVDRWVEIYGDWNPYAWDNDILTHRLFAWIVHWHPSLSADRLSNLAQARRNVMVRQLLRLRKTFKRTPDGPLKIKAAVVLALGGLITPSHPDKFLNRGLDWLDAEIDAQILADGGHISRSPQVVADILHWLTVLDLALEKRGVEPTKSHLRALERLRHILPFFQMPDGGLCHFHGSGISDRVWLKKLLSETQSFSKPFTYAPHSGFQRVHQNQTFILMDTGETPPPPYDTDAHFSPLAFEMSYGPQRLIVNCGWSPEQPTAWRQVIRETAAHSTLVMNDRSAGSLVRTGIRSRLFPESVETGVAETHVSRMEQSSGVWIEASHHGYLQRTGLAHRRRIFVDAEGLDLRGEDSLSVPLGHSPISRDEIPFDIRFHLHPNVRATLAQDLRSALLIQPGNVGWRFRTDAGPIRIEESVYLGEGTKPVKTEQIVISGRAFADGDGETKSNRIRWSIKRLEARS